uniref:Post-SET domain-containing protein n=1 Tax=Caulobacter phage BL57 TaxID=3348355 RepID=A0AB74UGV5_9VIRU
MRSRNLDDIDRFVSTYTYSCNCSQCNRKLKRDVTVERFLTGAYTHEEFEALVDREAEAEAERLALEPHLCKKCEVAGPKWLLIEMALRSEEAFPEPVPFKGSAMEKLLERHHVQKAHKRCTCGAACCSGWAKVDGYKITWQGARHARTYQEFKDHSR